MPVTECHDSVHRSQLSSCCWARHTTKRTLRDKETENKIFICYDQSRCEGEDKRAVPKGHRVRASPTNMESKAGDIAAGYYSGSIQGGAKIFSTVCAAQ
ncbi:hypothetical protein LSAT2_008576 [Lamellibrachia satsuma]|nr:hypothetical protein LSAT2_008576 [Lamellibrachia satsuma]